MDDEKTYAYKGSSEVWCVTHGSGLDKRQRSVQQKIFADGKPRVKPLFTFWGKGFRIKSKEQDTGDQRVQVPFSRKGLVWQTNNTRLDFSSVE